MELFVYEGEKAHWRVGERKRYGGGFGGKQGKIAGSVTIYVEHGTGEICALAGGVEIRAEGVFKKGGDGEEWTAAEGGEGGEGPVCVEGFDVGGVEMPECSRRNCYFLVFFEGWTGNEPGDQESPVTALGYVLVVAEG